MAKLAFTKAHGVGNDFLILERSSLGAVEPGALAQRMCDRHTGVGADGIVILGPSESADATFRIFNADGSEAEISGNAMRCAAAWLAQDRTPDAELALETRIGRRTLHFLRRDASSAIFRTDVGRPLFAAKDVPFKPPEAVTEPILNYPLPADDAAIGATILNMGNPQCILFVSDWYSVHWKGLGKLLERHAYFPERANIGFVRVVDDKTIEARFWERGAGHTLASGTGSCACAIAANLSGKCGREVRVRLERGELHVRWREDGMVELTGPAEITARGEFYL